MGTIVTRLRPRIPPPISNGVDGHGPLPNVLSGIRYRCADPRGPRPCAPQSHRLSGDGGSSSRGRRRRPRALARPDRGLGAGYRDGQGLAEGTRHQFHGAVKWAAGAIAARVVHKSGNCWTSNERMPRQNRGERPLVTRARPPRTPPSVIGFGGLVTLRAWTACWPSTPRRQSLTPSTTWSTRSFR